MTPEEIATTVETAWADYLVAKRRPMAPHAYVYASSFRRCDRRMVYDAVQPDKLPPFPPEVIARFDRGDDRERDLLATLHRLGRNAEPSFRIVGQQERFELRDHKHRVCIVGKVDARLEIDGKRMPIEIKSWSPTIVNKIERFEDVFENPWTEAGGYQLLSYLLGAGEHDGFLLLDRSGLPKLIPVALDPNLDRLEPCLVRAERVLDHIQAGTLPDYFDDPTECKRCPWYGHACNPPLAGGNGAVVLTDPELEAAIARRDALKAAADEFDDLDTDIKKRLRGIEHGLIGAYAIEGRWGKSSRLDVPDTVKQQYTVTNPKGRFTLTITKVA
jgi:hypothetical protein